MKLFAVILFCLFGLSSQHVNLLDGIREWRRVTEPYKSECICQSGVKSDLVDNFYRSGYVADDACLKCTFKCWADKLQFIDSLGNVDLKRFKEVIYGVDDEITQKCTSFNDVDLCQKVFNMARCVVGSVAAATPAPLQVLNHVPNLY